MFRERGVMQLGRFAVIAMVFAPVQLTSCGLFSGKDDGKCTQALSVTRTALEQGNLELVSQWRAYAYKHCGDKTALTTLDQEIQAKQVELAQRESKNQRAAQIAKLLTTFAAQHVASPRGQCFGKGHPDQGWCTRSQGVSGASSSFDVRYNQFEPDWVRFDTVIDGDVTCSDMGAMEIRTWSVRLAAGIGKRSQCSLPDGPLKGYSALISVEPDGTRVTLVSSKNLSRDAKLRSQLETEGQ